MPGEAARARRVFPAWMALVPAAAVLACYLWTIPFPFQFDDNRGILGDASIRDLSSPSAIMAANPSRPLTSLTYAVNYRAGGFSPGGYRAFNIALHAVNSSLLFVLAMLLLPAGGENQWHLRALFGSMVFALHPLQVESVVYVSSRPAVLCLMFYLGALISYLVGRGAAGGRRAACLGASTVLCAGAFMSKEEGITAPIAVLMMEFIFHSRGSAREFYGFLRRGGWAFALLPAAGLGSRLLLFGGIGRTDGAVFLGMEEYAKDAWAYLATEFYVILKYLRLAVLPFGLNVDHHVVPSETLLDPRAVASGIMVAFVAWIGVRLARRDGKAEGFSILMLLVTLAPTSSIIPLEDVMAEHRMYIPLAMAGIFAAAVSSKPAYPALKIPVWSAILIALAALTVSRSTTWESGTRLWQDAARKSPGKARPHYNLGNSYLGMEMFAEAESEFRRAIVIVPGFAAARASLGGVLLATGRRDEAELELRKALELKPGNVNALQMLAGLLRSTGRPAEAGAAYGELLAMDPGNAAAAAGMAAAEGDIMFGKGMYGEAVQKYSEALARAPGAGEIAGMMGIALSKAGRSEEAEKVFREQIRAGGRDPGAHVNLAMLMMDNGRAREAVALLEEAIRIFGGGRHAAQLAGVLEIARREAERARPATNPGRDVIKGTKSKDKRGGR